MSKLEEGMYVRTPLGIAKFLGNYDNDRNMYEFDKLDEELWSGDIYSVVFKCDMEDIVLKSSYNIIDLIEVGDYVNGVEIEQILDGKLWFDASDMRECCIESNQIKSIVTKEQFESVSYKVN